MILFCHVLPYMKKRGHEPKGRCRLFQFNQAVAEYFKLDDPKEKNAKVLLRCLKIPFVITFLLIAFGMFVMARTNFRK